MKWPNSLGHAQQNLKRERVGRVSNLAKARMDKIIGAELA